MDGHGGASHGVGEPMQAAEGETVQAKVKNWDMSDDNKNDLAMSLMSLIQGKTIHGLGGSVLHKQWSMLPRGFRARASFTEH